jgi:hypothetical protein
VSLDFFHGEKVKAIDRATIVLVHCLFLGGPFSENLFCGPDALIGGGLGTATPTALSLWQNIFYHFLFFCLCSSLVFQLILNIISVHILCLINL